MNSQQQNGCSEKYAELCALSTTGELTAEEFAELDAHVSECRQCVELLSEYTSLAHAGMAKLAAEYAPEPIWVPADPQREKREEQRLKEALRKGYSQPRRIDAPATQVAAMKVLRAPNKNLLWLVTTAAVFLVCVAGAFEVGRVIERRWHQPAIIALLPPSPAGDAEKVELQTKLASSLDALQQGDAKADAAERRIEELSKAQASLQARIDKPMKDGQRVSGELATTTAQRDSLQSQLADTSKSLEQVKQDLNRARQDRQGEVLRVAALEAEVSRLNAAMTITDRTATDNASYLAEDRDIRELMGARQLYIADVFDVQNNGERSKPFGRVFYTKGKSLLFYAFDLQAQAGYREAKAFQGWGKPDNASGKPISLGIFYMDNEKNRRWVLKSDNPDVLAQINAVFVTVEPHGGSAKPTGKPFLEAYLHSLPPNHP